MRVFLSLKHAIAVVLIVISFLIQVQSPVLAATQSADDLFFKHLTDQSYIVPSDGVGFTLPSH